MNRKILSVFIPMFFLINLIIKSQDIRLENEALNVEFYSDYPAVKLYTDKINGEVLYGDCTKERFLATIFHDNKLYEIIPLVDITTQADSSICFHMVIVIENENVVSFNLTYTLNNSVVTLKFDEVVELEGYKLLNIQSPDLISVFSNQQGAKLVFPEFEGRLVDIQNADIGEAEIDLSMAGWDRPLLCIMLYHQGLMGVVDYKHLDLKAFSRVFYNSNSEKICSIGMIFNYCYTPTDFTNAGFIEVFDSLTTDLSITINILKDFDGNNKTDWMDGAKLLRNNITSTPNENLTKSFMFQSCITCEIPGVTNFLNYIKKFNVLTDNCKTFITFNGYETGLPMLFGRQEEMKSMVGTIQEIRDVFKIAKESYNTSLDFYDLYTDYYPETPGYDADLRVVNKDGSFAPGWDFPGFNEKYKASLFDYANLVGIERIRNVLSYYPISDFHYIDALSLIFLKNYSKTYPSSYQKFRNGGQLLMDEFHKSGAMIFSEGLTSSFINHPNGVDYFLGIPRMFLSGLPYGNYEVIPLLEFILHGKTLYGLRDQHYFLSNQKNLEEAKQYGILEPLLLGANSNSQLYWESSWQYTIEKFYLVDLPWMLLNQRYFENYESFGYVARVTYDSDTYVEINYKTNTYTVEIDGKVVGQNYTTVYPKDSNTYLIFSRDAKTITIPLPIEWSDNIILQKLTEDGSRGNIPYSMVNNKLIFLADANTPYKLIRNDYSVISTPEKPELLYPLNNSVNQPSTYQWKVSSTPTAFYRLQVAVDSLFSHVVFDDSTITSSIFVVEELNNLYKYYWRVRGVNAHGYGP